MNAFAKARKSAELTLYEAANKLGQSCAWLRGIEGGCFEPGPQELAAMHTLYGAHLPRTEQLDLFGGGA